MQKFTENFGMTFAENRTYGVPEFAGTEVNQHSGNLKASWVPANWTKAYIATRQQHNQQHKTHIDHTKHIYS
jgi:hypothetical protein